MIAIILAGGNGERFRDLGRVLPKPLLPVRHNGVTTTMLNHVVRTVPEWMQVMVAIPEPLLSTVNMFSQVEVGVQVVPVRESRSPVDTLHQSLRYVPRQVAWPVLVLDCDTVLDRRDIERLCAYVVSGFNSSAVAVTRNDDDRNMSRVDRVPWPTRFVEKEPISSWGIVSARAFHNSRTLCRVLDPARDTHLSPVLERYPGRCFAYVLNHPWLDWGTPERLAATGAMVV